MKNKWNLLIFNYFFIILILLLNIFCYAQTSDEFYEVYPNNFYNNLESLQQQKQQFSCPPFGICDFNLENNNQFFSGNIPIDSTKSFYPHPSSQNQQFIAFNENERKNANEFPTLIPPYKINKEEQNNNNNIARQINNIGENGCNNIGNLIDEIKDVSLQRSIPAVQFSSNNNLKELFPYNNNYYGSSFIKSNNNNNINSFYQFPQSQGNFGSYSNQIIGNNNNNEIISPYDFNIEGINEYNNEEEEEQQSWNENYEQQKLLASFTGNLIGEIAANNIIKLKNEIKGKEEKREENSLDDEQIYLNNKLPYSNIWQNNKNLFGSSSSNVAPFIELETSLQGIDKNTSPCSLNKEITQFNKNIESSSSLNSPSILSSSSSNNNNNNPSNEQHQPLKKSVTSIQGITQQILRLPAVLYSDSKSSSSRKLETLLREVYGLPLVTFYVDRIGNKKPKIVEYNLEQLTAHHGLPYLFICGTFIGSKEHILNYHKQNKISQLVEYVCNKENNKEEKEETTNLNNFNKKI